MSVKNCVMYFLLRGGVVVYIGVTCDYTRRMQNHKYSKKVFDSIRAYPVDYYKAHRFEVFLIKMLKPEYNSKFLRHKGI